MDALKQFLEQLTQEATQIQIQGRALSPEEIARVKAIYQAIPYLQQALDILSAEPTNLVTYKIFSDADGKLKRSARIACNFWNRFIIPKSSTVIRLGIFTLDNNTIARAYKPYMKNGIAYGVVEFNTKFLSQFMENQISGTIVHEIGHTLGFGWDAWMALFDSATGKFTEAAIGSLDALQDMLVETDYGPGTRYSHWDEATFDKEIMTGINDNAEHVLPVTIGIMNLLGHRVIEELPEETKLKPLLDSLTQVVFSRQAAAKAVDLDHFEQTEIMENIPHSEPLA